MKTVRKIVQYLEEEITTRAGNTELQMVPHNLSVEQTFEAVIDLLRGINSVSTRDEMKDLAAILVKELAELASAPDSETVDPSLLKIREV
jgi:hypothetical protein